MSDESRPTPGQSVEVPVLSVAGCQLRHHPRTGEALAVLALKNPAHEMVVAIPVADLANVFGVVVAMLAAPQAPPAEAPSPVIKPTLFVPGRN